MGGFTMAAHQELKRLSTSRHVLRRQPIRLAARCGLWARFEPRLFLMIAKPRRNHTARPMKQP
jgi:hypothetical protein